MGQAHGPFWLPCHNSPGFGAATRTDPTHRQCAGAAIFRANTGRAELMPPALLALPEDKETVFSGYAEFIAHHEHMPVEAAEQALQFLTPDVCMASELSKQQAKQMRIPKQA